MPTEAPVIECIEDRTERPYLLYVPSRYSDNKSFPLVVACHGTWPYDQASYQMQEWANFAEHRSIIVAAPNLLAARGDFPPGAAEQIARQEQDETAILAMVSEIKRKYNIAESRVFLTGWSAGAFDILYTGLKNPDVFRALVVRQGSFDPRFVATIPPQRLDPWQPIQVIYGHVDALRDQSKAMVEWLRERELYVKDLEISGAHRRINPEVAWRFFREIARERPWIRITGRSVLPESPLEYIFAIECIPTAVKQKWFFDEGEISYEPTPRYRFDGPGWHKVRVNVEVTGDNVYHRWRWFDVRPPDGVPRTLN